MRFMIEAINSPRPVRRFIVEHIFVNAYRQYGRCHRELRESGNSELLCQAVSKGSEIEVTEIDGDEIVGFSLAYLSDSNRTCSRFACVCAVLV